MMDVTVPLAGKNAACNDPDIIPALVKLLRDADTDVKARAAGALMTITITTKGKTETDIALGNDILWLHGSWIRILQTESYATRMKAFDTA